MSKIRVLPDALANKIAAGEVVERPASVVKELLENALDAGAARIDLEIEAGGKRLIRIVDDGEGMTRDDAITAFERHATSKIRTPDDLDSITTLGFRGEALPSIAAVSRLCLRTNAGGGVEGTELEFSGGKLLKVRDIAWAGGTEVEVRDLFFNTPGRRKFLKSDPTEGFHITNLVQHYALANPEVGFLLVNNGREVMRLIPARSLRERAYQVLGGGLLAKLVEVNGEIDGNQVHGFVSNPQEQRSSRDAQYFFVNGRFVRDQLLGRALTEAYRSMMPAGVHPAAVLFIEVRPLEVDVNVHPAKTEVRFLHEGRIVALVRDAIADALTSTRPVTQLTVPGKPKPGVMHLAQESSASDAGPRGSSSLGADAESAAPGIAEAGEIKSTSSASLGSAENRLGPDDSPRKQASLSIELLDKEASAAPAIPSQPVRRIQSGSRECSSVGAVGTQGGSSEGGIDWARDAVDSATPAMAAMGHGIKPLGQIRDSYIVATDEEGLLLIDQHVAHERILFERFRGREGSRVDDVQPLLIVETLDLSPAAVEAYRIVKDELDSVGIETMELSGRSIAIKTSPVGLGSTDVIGLVLEVLSVVESERRNFTIEHIRDEIAASVACKAAIKINMPLSNEKMEWLIDELMKTANPMTCPHGRPIIMRFGLRDIERGFKRPV